MHISTIDKIKTTTFVLRNRLKGYKLLQNPKGTNPNEVTMVKTWFGFNPDFYDKHYHYHRIHRYQKENKLFKDETLLLTEYFMDFDTKTYSGKRKNCDGYIVKNSEFRSLNKTRVSDEEIDKRPLPEWKDGNEEYDFGEKLFWQNREGGYYLPQPSFWHVLRTNLKGGGIK